MIRTIKNSYYNQGHLYYSIDNHEFNSTPDINSDITLVIAYIQIGFDSETKNATQIWGFHHNFNWIEQELTIPIFSKGEVKLDIELEPGDSKRIKDIDKWNTYYDRKSGWIKIGPNSGSNANQNIEFFTNTVISIDENGEINSLWLRPHFYQANE